MGGSSSGPVVAGTPGTPRAAAASAAPGIPVHNLRLGPLAIEQLIAEQPRDGGEVSQQVRPVLCVCDFPAPLQKDGEERGEEGIPQEGVAEVGGDGGHGTDDSHDPHQLDAGVDVVVRLRELALYLLADVSQLGQRHRVADVAVAGTPLAGTVWPSLTPNAAPPVTPVSNRAVTHGRIGHGGVTPVRHVGGDCAGHAPHHG
mmetsp:Transcript_24276/g.60313  ORF Transcript_24276/g.60313 Transcript_24276/m.60313 type:complete len:201 (+) Transcript_24276:4632-5234(+)